MYYRRRWMDNRQRVLTLVNRRQRRSDRNEIQSIKTIPLRVHRNMISDPIDRFLQTKIR